MKNASNRFLDALAAQDAKAGGTGSDYRLAQLLDVPRGTVSNYRRGVSQLDDVMAVRLADLLKVNPLTVVAEVHAERASNARVRSFWSGVARKGGKAAAVILTAGTAALAHPLSEGKTAFSGGDLAGRVCILC